MLTTIVIVILVLASGLALAIFLGDPKQPAPLDNVVDPFKQVDFSDLPAAATYTAHDGKTLTYRSYLPSSSSTAPSSTGSVVLIHGSSGDGASLHVLAKALCRAGFAAYALDMRGHGKSGPHGHIAFIGQLESDLRDFVQQVNPARSRILAGFSSGGGFVLRFAGGVDQELFDRYVLLSPFIGRNSPTQRPASGGWVSVGVARILGLLLLNALGIKVFNNLTVLRFATGDIRHDSVTSSYDFNLMRNFQPQDDFVANIRAVRQPCEIVVGSEDELFYADKFTSLLQQAGVNWRITHVPNSNHIGLTLDAPALSAIVAAAKNPFAAQQFGR